MRRQLLLSLAATLLALPALARDFDYTYEGQTLTYTVINEEAKTCEVKAGTGNKISGDLIIPEVADVYSVTSIGNHAFYKCSGLTSVTFPNSVTSIGYNSFFMCIGLTSVTLPNSVASIGDYAFQNCIGLTSVTLPNSVTSIGDFAFCYCRSLPLIEIPGSVKIIGERAFGSCNKLEAIKVDISNQYFKSIDGVLFDSAATTIIQFPKGKAEQEYTIPNSVTSIGDDAFYDCIGLTSVTLPNSVTSIGYCAFDGCIGLTSVTLPNSVTSIGNFAFSRCSGLTSVTLPNSVTSIGYYAFNSCSGLQLIEIPGSVKKIGEGAFGNCDKLEAIKVDSSNPYFKSIDGVLFDSAATTLIQFPSGKAEREYIIPNSVTSIGGNAFYGCHALTSVTLPNSVTSIGNYAFDYCSGLTSVTIPNSVTSIGVSAFSNCSCLMSITSLALTPPECGGAIVDDTSAITLYVPQEAIESYKEAENWKNFVNISALKTEPYEAVINGLHYILTPSNQTATVTYTERSSTNYQGLHNVIIPETVNFEGLQYTVTTIGDYAFNYCNSLTSVTIPNSVTSIGGYAFAYCSGLTSITIPNSVSSISYWAFGGCRGLTSVTLPNSVTSIGLSAFYYCSCLPLIEIPGSVKKIGDNAF
ncbi:MAG: leucine-rich repeat domain-containing protein, partial [Muribaculaceae bacterium]|nr:leucine-rich repeat domain-containing protein [Muribaculaceae bacterium]